MSFWSEMTDEQREAFVASINAPVPRSGPDYPGETVDWQVK